jgi:hypothetical protein
MLQLFLIKWNEEKWFGFVGLRMGKSGRHENTVINFQLPIKVGECLSVTKGLHSMDVL